MLKVLSFALLAGCGGGVTPPPEMDDTAEPLPDLACPSITHTPVSETQAFGADVHIEVTVTDDTRATFVTLHYKLDTADSGGWDEVLMVASGDVYTGTIQGNDHSGSGIDYFIEAQDPAQNKCFSPEEGAYDPYHFRIAE